MLASLDLKGEDVQGTAADAVTYFRWRHGLLCGQPVKKIFLPWPDGISCGEVFDYRSRRLAYENLDEDGFRDRTEV